MTTFWNLIREMGQIDNQFSEIAKGLSSNSVRNVFLPGVSSRHFPMMNVFSGEDEIVVEALAPGIDVENLKVSAFKDKLVVSGEKMALEVEEDMFHRNERSAGKFMRTIELPVPIDADRVEAEYNDGILKISLPKAEEAKPRQIKIKTGS